MTYYYWLEITSALSIASKFFFLHCLMAMLPQIFVHVLAAFGSLLKIDVKFHNALDQFKWCQTFRGVIFGRKTKPKTKFNEKLVKF